jgi:hypothetical protein
MFGALRNECADLGSRLRVNFIAPRDSYSDHVKRAKDIDSLSAYLLWHGQRVVMADPVMSHAQRNGMT